MKKIALLLIVMTSLSACAVWRTPPIARIALLASFEGRYREVGYTAIYPARLALRDAGLSHLELVAVDDGGTPQTAQARARALALDDSIKAVMVMGYDSADVGVLEALGDLPVIIIGEWATTPINDHIFIMSHSQIPEMLSYAGRLDITAPVETLFQGGDAFGLFAYADLYNQTNPLPHVQIVTSGAFAPLAFRERLLASDIYVPPPSYLSTTVYDATRLLAHVIADADMSRQAVADTIRSVDYMGEWVGRIRFGDNGYWADAPLYMYVYADNQYDGHELMFIRSMVRDIPPNR
jgi:ABC-type branched-subunit amino acid transport system substrate-binding protein